MIDRYKPFPAFLFAALAFAASASPSDIWACRTSHPAVVNAVLPLENTLSLRGEWEVVTNRFTPRNINFSPRMPSGPDVEDAWWNRKDTMKLRVPGCWEAQGVGEPGNSAGWSCWWDFSPRPLRNAFAGNAWYRKRVAVPAGWKGRRIWLKIGGVNAQGWFWVNGERVAWADDFCGTRKFEITDIVEPGRTAWVIASVRNDVPSRRGCLAGDCSWGGIIRDVELEATPETFIDDAWVRGDFDSRTATAHVSLEGIGREAGLAVRVSSEGESVRCAVPPADAGATACRIDLKLPLGSFRPWSPEHPNLYTAKVELVSADGSVRHTRFERFGVRKFETRGNEFYLNGKPFFMRGAGLHWIWPIEGLPPPDRETFLERVRVIRSAGFNFVRTHTSCPYPEFFEAADEAGLMVEAELPYYQDSPTHDQPFDPVRDMKELVAAYRRYPSFAVLSGGNEGWFGDALSKRLYDEFKRLAPDRLMIGQDRWYDPKIHQQDTSDYQGGPMSVWPRGTVRTRSPFVCHEYLNLVVKLDSRIANRFTGCWQMPGLSEARAAWLATNGLEAVHGNRLQDAQHVLQGVWRKYGFEAARGDPLCAGYSYWSLQDSCSPQKGAFAGQALFDPFWKTKPHGETAADVRVYNSPTCLLLDDGADAVVYEKDPRIKPNGFEMFVMPGMTNRVRRSGDVCEWRFRLAHYGERAFAKTRLSWKLETSSGEILLSGTEDTGAQGLGPVRDIAAVRPVLPAVDRPCKAVLRAALCENGVEVAANGWEYWVFPGRRTVPVSAVAASDGLYDVLKDRLPGLLPWSRLDDADSAIAPEGSAEAQEALSRGLGLVTLENTDGPMNAMLGWWWMGSQMGAVLTEHPILSELPHEGFLTPLVFRLMRKGKPLPAVGVPSSDLVVYGEGGDCCYLYMAAREMPSGNRVVTVSGLDLLSDTPEGLAVWSGIFRWLAVKRRADGLPVGDQLPAIGPDPFPDRLSAYVWRNWGLVDRIRLAETVGADVSDITRIAVEMGLPADPAVEPEWATDGYITVIRRNWHLLDYDQLLKLTGMTTAGMKSVLVDHDFLFQKLGRVKPLCAPLVYDAEKAAATKAARRNIAAVLKSEGVDASLPCQPRFAFMKELCSPAVAVRRRTETAGLRLMSSYFADFGDPLGDDEVGSYPDRLLDRLANEGVNAIWLPVAFKHMDARHYANARKLTSRAAKRGLGVYVYLNEPRGDGKPACTSQPSVRRYLVDRTRELFTAVPGLQGAITITASENLTSCASHGGRSLCPECRRRSFAEIVADVNSDVAEGMHAANPGARLIVWDWGWDSCSGEDWRTLVPDVLARLPKENVGFLTVSERFIPTCRGEFPAKVNEYSISTPGPGERALTCWKAARDNGLGVLAKVQASASWEFASVPYLPCMDLVAEHAWNLKRAGVDNMMLSWSVGAWPSPNLRLFGLVRSGDSSPDAALDRLAAELYGREHVAGARAAWKAYSDGFREFPFWSCVLHRGPHHMGPANPLHAVKTGYRATMTGVPYDDLSGWCDIYPEETWISQMAKVRDGFASGNRLFAEHVASLDGDRRACAEREVRMFRAIELHFRSVVDQAEFIRARRRCDRRSMRIIAERELSTAKELLEIVRADARVGYECANHYFYVPQDLMEKILNCRTVCNGASAGGR